jgi:hypothetical protein
MLKEELEKRYAPFGGINGVLEAYKAGEITLTVVSEKVGLSKTNVSDNLKAAFGLNVLEDAKSVRRSAIIRKKELQNIKAGENVEMAYADAVAYLESGEIPQKGFLKLYKTILKISIPVTGKPKRVWLSSHGLYKIEGVHGIVKIRYAEPLAGSNEYRLDRRRFKIISSPKIKIDAYIFCIKAGKCWSFYRFPSNKLKVQSLNLKFAHHENSKYAAFLLKVESL